MPHQPKKLVKVHLVGGSRKLNLRPRGERTRKRATKGSNASLCTPEYIASLCDPFEHSGTKLGWGTLIPTRVEQAYLRGTTTANADGTLALAAAPSAKGMLYVGNSGGAAGFGSNVDASDLTAITGNFTDGRVISLGIRAFPSIAATAAPGYVYAGALPGMTNNTLAACTTADLTAFPTSHMSIGYDGACATGRPVDPSSFLFSPLIVNGSGWPSTTTTVIPFSIPYIAFQGLPAGATVAYEVVLNFEGTTLLAHNATALGMGEDTTGSKTVSDEWSSVEQMWHAVKPALPPPGRPFEWSSVIDGAAALAGGAIGGYFGGTAGAGVGSNIGRSLSQLVTGPRSNKAGPSMGMPRRLNQYNH